MESVFKDLRFAFRGLLKRPAFTAIAIVTLGLGIGATTAIFSVVNSVMLRRLPYRTADRIVVIQEINPDGKRIQVTGPNFLDWRAQNTVFEHLAAIKKMNANLTLADQAERIDMAQTSANFFDVFGVGPQQGRLFVAGDEQAGHAPVAVLSDALWRRRFAADTSVIGKPITLDGNNYTVVGIAPEGFQYPNKTELWLPPLKLAPEFSSTVEPTERRGMGYLNAVGLLKPGLTLAQAASEMETITGRLRQQYPDTNNRRFDRVYSLHNHLIGDSKTMLWLLFGAVGFVLLIACANVANLLLASATSRSKEIAIRSALGASRSRVMRQLLTESAMLALAGGLFGLLLSSYGVTAITKLLPQTFPRLNEIGMDWRVFGFTLGASLLTGVLFGFAPALHISRADVQEAMKETGRGTAGSARHTRLRHALIVAEVALSVVLLAGAGLLFRSFMRLQAVNAGFTSQQVLTAQLSPAGPQFDEDSDVVTFYDQVLDRVKAIPGVESAGVINTLPLSGGPTIGFRVEGRPILTRDKWVPTDFRSVSPDYFRAMSIPVLQGRPFMAEDRGDSPRTLIINQALAQREFPNEDPIGKRITLGNTDENNQPLWFEIIGVTANVRSQELREEPAPELYFSAKRITFQNMAIVVRSTVEPESVAPALRQAVAEVDRTVPVAQVQTMEHIVSESVTQPRFNLFLVGLFGGIALLLSAAGIYGVTSYTVTQRTHELGIRLALGAQVSDVLKLVLGQGLAVIGIGLVVGLAASFALLRLMRSLLFGVGENDPLTFAAITLVLFLVALFACYVPARRATKVDPLEALRYE
ncbi:MAG TPA: ABC transporter permease [Pyrinomonadaceae bacterium]|nr:ABC transporter permease [Pyrinomonadaceae bacterium]